MSIYTLWLENDWVVKTMIIATMTTTIIIFEKLFQFYITLKSFKEMNELASLNELDKLQKSHVKTLLEDLLTFKDERKELFDANIGVKLDIFESYMMRYISVLGLIAILSPMLGLIGTFLGVWHVFEGVSQVSLSDPAVIAKGIKEVLIDTVSGLMVAVYAMIFYKSFEIFVHKQVMQFESKLYKLLKEK